MAIRYGDGGYARCVLPMHGVSHGQHDWHDTDQREGILSLWHRFVEYIQGKVADSHSADTVMGRLKQLIEHVHKPSNVYPTLAAGVTIAGGAGAWALGNFVEVVPANTITEDFDIHYVHLEAASANDTYELVLYYGATDIECARCRALNGTTLDASTIPVMTPLIPANSQIRAKLASASGGDNVTIALQYHTY